MKKNYLLTVLVIVLIVINAITIGILLSRSNHGKPPHKRNKEPKAIIIERLNFDADQIESFLKLIEEHKSNIDILEEKRIKAKSKLYSALSQDTKSLDNLYADLGLIQERIEKIHFEHFKQIKALCNEEQIPYFNNLSKDFGKIFGLRPMRRPPGRP